MLLNTPKNQFKVILYKNNLWVMFSKNHFDHLTPLIKFLKENTSLTSIIFSFNKMTLDILQLFLEACQINSMEKQVSKVIYHKEIVLKTSLKKTKQTILLIGSPPIFQQGEMPFSLIPCWLNQFKQKPSHKAISMTQYDFKALDDMFAHKPSYSNSSLSIWGGLNDDFKKTSKPCYGYDINSLYPLCMLNPLPSKKPVDHPHKENKLGIMEATMTYPSFLMPFLPSKCESQTRFQWGQWSGTYSSMEIEYLKKMGAKIKIHKAWYFDKKFTLPYNIILELFNQKKTTSNPMFKLWLNSLYGQLAVSRSSPYSKLKDNNHIYHTPPLSSRSPSSGKWTLMKTPSKKKDTPPFQIWGSFITAHARLFLHNLFTGKTQQPSYIDTDALFINHPYDPSTMGNKLGQLKQITPPNSSAVFAGTKLYTTMKGKNDNVIKASGLKDPSLETMLSLFNNHPSASPLSIKPRRVQLSKNTSWPHHHPIKSTPHY